VGAESIVGLALFGAEVFGLIVKIRNHNEGNNHNHPISIIPEHVFAEVKG